MEVLHHVDVKIVIETNKKTERFAGRFESADEALEAVNEFLQPEADDGYLSPAAAYAAPMEPVVPCSKIETRACIDINDDIQFRTQPCPQGECHRYPGREIIT